MTMISYFNIIINVIITLNPPFSRVLKIFIMIFSHHKFFVKMFFDHVATISNFFDHTANKIAHSIFA